MVALADVRQRRDEIDRIAARHGARDVRLFGSVVRGDAEADSDLDVLVQLDPERSLLDQVALKRDLESLLGCAVDVVVDDAVRPALRDRIFAEAVPL